MVRRILLLSALWTLTAALLAQQALPPLPPPPPPPSARPTPRPPQPAAAPVEQPQQNPAGLVRIPQPAGLPPSQGVPLPLLGQSLPTLPPSVLAWDSDNKEYNAKPGELSAVLTYYLTNVSSSDVLINHVRTSCGCTVPKLPSQPWKLAPGESGELPFTIDLRGKSGNLTKVATLETSQGFKSIVLRVNIPALPSSATAMGDRLRNIQIAVADRQAVFKGDCAKCHVEPGLGKTGEALFKGVCGVCHLAERRASMVPDLHALKVPTGPEYWRTWITAGKPGSLMPAFAKPEGGPLTDEQITSLVDQLTATITKAPSPTTTAAPVPPPSSGPGGH